MDLNAHAAGLNLHFIEGEPTDYLFSLTDWAGKEAIELGAGMLSGTVAGIREEERWEVEVEDLPQIEKKVITFPKLRPGRYVYELWAEWSDVGRNRLVAGAISVEASVNRTWREMSEPPVGKRELNVRVAAGQEGTIKAYVMINGFVASRAAMAEEAAGRAAGSAAQASQSELVAKAAEKVAEACREVVEEARGEVEELADEAAGSAEDAKASATASKDSADAAKKSAQDAAGSATQAAASAAKAAESAEAAHTSEMNAAASATVASERAAAAKASASDAAGSASQAGQSATQAAERAQDAATSASQSADSASQAAQSAEAAHTSEMNAAGSEAAAHSSEEYAAQSATQAAESAKKSAESATQSAGSATQSAASASEAGISAAAAEASASEAASSAQESATSATQSADSASQSTERAKEAETSAAKAQASAETAQEAMGKASFELWQENGHPNGTVQEYLEDLKGYSAYETWLAQGHEGSEADFLDSLQGHDGRDGDLTRELADEVYVQYKDFYQTSESSTLSSDTDGVADALYLDARYAPTGYLVQVSIPCRTTAARDMYDGSAYLMVQEEDEDGGDFVTVGVSQTKVKQAVGATAVWKFANEPLHGRRLRIRMVADRYETSWDQLWLRMGVHAASRTEDDANSSVFLQPNTHTAYVAEVHFEYHSDVQNFAPLSHVDDTDKHLRPGERDTWNAKLAEEDITGEDTLDIASYGAAQGAQQFNACYVGSQFVPSGRLLAIELPCRTEGDFTGSTIPLYLQILRFTDGETKLAFAASSDNTQTPGLGTVCRWTFSQKNVQLDGGAIALYLGTVPNAAQAQLKFDALTCAASDERSAILVQNAQAKVPHTVPALKFIVSRPLYDSPNELRRHALNAEMHVSKQDRDAWNAKADATALTAHIDDTTKHITATERSTWNAKVDTATLTSHIDDSTKHITATERSTWNAKVDTATLTSHINDTTKHPTSEEKQAWNAKADATALTTHINDSTKHITAAERNTWNGHIDDTTKHITAIERTSWNGIVTNYNAHAANTTIHLTSQEKTKVGSIINSPLVMGSSETNTGSVWLYTNAKTIDRTEDTTPINIISGANTVYNSNNNNGNLILGNNSTLGAQDLTKNNWYSGVTIIPVSAKLYSKPHTSQYATVIRGTHIFGCASELISTTADNKLNTSTANEQSLYNQGVTTLGMSSFYYSAHQQDGVIVAGSGAHMYVPYNRGIILAGSISNANHPTYGTINANIAGTGIALIGGGVSTFQTSTVSGSPTQHKGYLKFVAGSYLVDNAGNAIVTNGVSQLPTAAQKTAWTNKLGCSVGGLTDVRYYASESAAPALNNRAAGVLYLIGES